MFRAVLLSAFALLAACESRSITPGSAPAEAVPAPDGVTRFGEPLKKADTVPLAQVLSAPDQFADKTVTVEGKVRRNCTAKGCWMELSEGLDVALPGCRVTFKDYGFFVPTDSQGSAARVQGLVNVKTVSAGEVRHMEGEGATFANKLPDGTAREVRLVATGVELTRGT